MANEISYATYLSNGGRVARLLSSRLHELLYDPTGLRFLMTQLPWGGAGSDTSNVTRVARGLVMAAASSEISGGFSNTLVTTTNYDCTVARYGAVLQPTDLFRITGGPIDVEYLIGILAQSLDLTLTDLLTGLFANVAGNVGTSGVDLSTDDFFDAIYYCNLKLNPRALSAVLHQQQVNDLIESCRGETGPMQWRSDAQGLLTPPGVGFVGQFAGVTIYQSDSVPLTGGSTDRRGCMFSEGAFAYQLAPVSAMQPMIDPADIIVGTPEMFIERNRDAANGMTSLIVNAYPGVAEQEDLRAVRITTDA
jgi:hypothetical protein